MTLNFLIFIITGFLLETEIYQLFNETFSKKKNIIFVKSCFRPFRHKTGLTSTSVEQNAFPLVVDWIEMHTITQVKRNHVKYTIFFLQTLKG